MNDETCCSMTYVVSANDVKVTMTADQCSIMAALWCVSGVTAYCGIDGVMIREA